MTLYEAVRSSASFRVRIALNLKGLPYESVLLDLRKSAHRSPDYARVNPARAVPALVDGSHTLAQSMAILEYLDERYPLPPLLPATPRERARVRAISQLIACDIHPLDNLRVLSFLEKELRVEEPDRDRWYHHWIHEGFGALEQILREPTTGTFCQGEAPTMADCCLVPQVVNALRFKVDLGSYPRILRIHQACMKIDAFARAHPDRQ